MIILTYVIITKRYAHLQRLTENSKWTYYNKKYFKIFVVLNGSSVQTNRSMQFASFIAVYNMYSLLLVNRTVTSH